MRHEEDINLSIDTCMTSLFSSTWMCRHCGREACGQCYKTIHELTSDPNKQEVVVRRERHAQANPFFLSCARRTEHTIASFNPVSRFLQKELDDSVSEMEQLVGKNADVNSKEEEGDERNSKGDSTVGSEGTVASSSAEVKREGRIESGDNQGQSQFAVGADALADSGVGIGAKRESNRTTVDPPTDTTNSVVIASANPLSSTIDNAQPANLSSSSTSSKVSSSEGNDDGVCTLVAVPVPPSLSSASSSASSLPPVSATSSSLPTWPVPYYTGDSLTEAAFSALWAKGVPLVVTGLLGRFQIEWTPEYFKAKYGSQACIILECQLDTNKRVTVGDFFEWFGKYEGRTECWKLKVSHKFVSHSLCSAAPSGRGNAREINSSSMSWV